MIDIQNDLRWKRFNDPDRIAPNSGRQFNGMFPIDFDHPHPWRHVSLQVSGEDTLEFGDDRLTADLCQVGQSFFIRGEVRLPLLGTKEALVYTPWISVSLDNFKSYLNSKQSGDFSSFSSANGWMMNYLQGWDMTSWLPATLNFIAEASRPVIDVHPHHHPISMAQRNGVNFDQVLDLYAAAGHDIRPHLLED
ncbi:DUF2199 domain-containing protein [Actibacterium pelagium]|uniref:DUF2199 domain-containing protein n=1 Tax=Actibacterium pelagium TaxID=2029103 RepID=A0A917AG78_9RHOB|nr:DUF2199 domain-containing protein [Actibacterium pelagium]GGE46223.1 hypothetical protein GCM10011517_12400 [Actibacterium pelagium]